MLARTVADATDSVLARVVAPTWWTIPSTDSELESSAAPPTDSVLARMVGSYTDSVLARVVAPT